MNASTLEIVITCDEGYLNPLRTMLYSLRANNPARAARIWLLHRDIDEAALGRMASFCSRLDLAWSPLRVDQHLFDDARASQRYPQEMYYRLLAPHIIDAPLERILYLDPDVLVINPLDALYDIDLEGNAFAAASHLDAIHPATALNNARLNTDAAYFNTGVLLFDVDAARARICPKDVLSYASENRQALLFPDQDLFNALYGDTTLLVPDAKWNYDARKYPDNIIRTGGTAKLDWVMENTAILHFCGKDKPWNPRHRGQFTALYKHYAARAGRL